MTDHQTAPWLRYSESWALPEVERLERLAETVTPDVTYTDPNITLSGIAAFSDYMAQFQANLPGAHFRICKVADHHARSLSHWVMCDSTDTQIGTGSSFAMLSPSGKFAQITGFFGAA